MIIFDVFLRIRLQREKKGRSLYFSSSQRLEDTTRYLHIVFGRTHYNLWLQTHTHSNLLIALNYFLLSKIVNKSAKISGPRQVVCYWWIWPIQTEKIFADTLKQPQLTFYFLGRKFWIAYNAKISPATGVYFSKNRCLNL